MSVRTANVRWGAGGRSRSRSWGCGRRAQGRTRGPRDSLRGWVAEWHAPVPPLRLRRALTRRKPDIPVPYLYFDMGAAVLCASFMSFGVKRRWFALGAALQLAVSTYIAYVGGHVHYGDWLKVSRLPDAGPEL